MANGYGGANNKMHFAAQPLRSLCGRRVNLMTRDRLQVDCPTCKRKLIERVATRFAKQLAGNTAILTYIKRQEAKLNANPRKTIPTPIPFAVLVALRTQEVK